MSLGIETEDHTDAIYNAGAVHVEIRYSVRRTKGVYPSGAPRNVEINFRQKKFVDAYFAPGRSEFRGKAKTGQLVTVRLLDGAGQPTTGRPEFFELTEPDGSRYRFHARSGPGRSFGVLKEWQPPGKPAQTIEEMGISILTDEHGVIRQVRNPFRTVYVKTLGDQGYQIAVYKNHQVSQEAVNGLYTVKNGEVALSRQTFRNPDDSRSDSLESVEYKQGEFKGRYMWVTNMKREYDLMELTEEGEFLRYRKKSWSDYNRDLHFYIRSIKNSDGEFESNHNTWTTMSGKWKALQKTVKIGGETVSTINYTYIKERGPNYGKLKSKWVQNAGWEAYDYDDQGRKVLKIVPVEAPPTEGSDQNSPSKTRYVPESPPENPGEALKNGRVTQYFYADDQTTEPSEFLLHEDGEFVSRSWFTYNVLHKWRQMTREEISHNAEGKPGDPENEIRFSQP